MKGAKSKKLNKGLVIIFEGEGKGKTSAAMGLAVRAAGTGLNVCIIQFVKGDWPSGELFFFKELKKLKSKKIGKIDVHLAGRGFVKILGDKKPFAEHVKAAERGLSLALKIIKSGRYDVLILDEAISAVEEKLLKPSDLLKLVATKTKHLHLVMTGHYAPKILIKKADLVSNIKMVKHPYYKGILAEKGIDY